ncbi:GNAT family N-acetyltransferase [Robiginitalea sp. SC105]|uniref:GNAT family N-acetyltransferase n=1 Tax=Robiginitalea sp. SC105 TaxID=2762332 RepID=UPI00163A9C8A|nr:GNAT family N-acetyltransferase [Robiginitalea sp. SC105]MBC2840675.1 GNAT family N-acetyltransferase [Robiginitalea sp. SC105]
MIRIEEARSRKDLKSFVRFPFKLYRNSPYWVPPIISEELASFDPAVNPVFRQADAQFFLAYRGREVVGRVAAIVNRTEVESQGLKKMRFGWFDFVDDPQVSRALIEKVAEIGISRELEYMEGPMGFSNMDKVGVLTEGFDHIGTMVTWYNYPYYAKHLEDLGFTPEKEYLESKFPASNADPALFTRVEAMIRERYGLRALNFNKTSDIMPWTDQMFDLFNASYSSLSSFVPISEAQKAYFKKKYIGFINPEYIKFIVDKEDRIIAFAIVMPAFSKALQKARGRLFPLGFRHLLHARKHNKDAVFYLIGIDPEYQNKGVTSIIFNEYYKVFKEKGIEMCYRTPELAENKAIQQMWKHFSPEVYKRRRTYRKSLT